MPILQELDFRIRTLKVLMQIVLTVTNEVVGVRTSKSENCTVSRCIVGKCGS
jgi:hypothetical protein